MTSMDRSSSGADSRRSSGRSTPTSQVQRQTPTNFNSVEIKNPLLGAAVSYNNIHIASCKADPDNKDMNWLPILSLGERFRNSIQRPQKSLIWKILTMITQFYNFTMEFKQM